VATPNPQVLKLVKPNPDARPERDADRLLQLLTGEARPGPLDNQPFPDLGPRPNLFMRLVGNPIGREFKGAVTAFKTESITGAAADAFVEQSMLFLTGDRRFMGDANDPDFVLEESPVVQEAFKKHPFLFDDARSGMLGDIKTETGFRFFLNRRLQQIQDVDELNQTNIVNRFFLTGVGQVGDIVTGGLILEGVGAAAKGTALARSIKNAAVFLRGTSKASRITRVAAISLGNAAQELGINFINPNRPDKIDANVAMAGLFGLAIGGALEGAIMSGGKQMFGVAGKHVNETMREFRGSMGPETPRNMAEEFKANEAFAQEVLSKDVTGPRTINLYDTPQTNIQAKALRKKFDDAGMELIIGKLDADGLHKLGVELEGLNEEIFRRANAITSGPAKLARKVQSLLDVVTPGGRLRRTSSDTVRRAHRTIFGDAEPSVSAIKEPIRADTPVAAESLMMGHRKENIELRLSLFKAIDDHNLAKKGAFKYTLSNGEQMTIKTRWQANQYYRSVVDYMRRLSSNKRKGVALPEVPKSIQDGVDAHNAWSKLRANQLEQVGLMKVSESALTKLQDGVAKADVSLKKIEGRINSQKDPAKLAKLLKRAAKSKDTLARKKLKAKEMATAVDRQQNHLTRRWQRDVIQRRRVEFVGLLRKQFGKNREVDYWTGKALVPDERVLEPRALENVAGLDLGEMLESVGKEIEEITEADLRAFNAGFHEQYLNEIESLGDRLVEATAANMLDLKNAHGVEHAFSGPNVLRSRLLEIDETDFAEFLDDNLDQMIGAYDHMVSGRIATRRAIQLDADFWRPEVKRLLNEDLTLDTEQIIRTISKDYQNKIDLAEKLQQADAQGLVKGKKGAAKLQASLIRQANDAKRIFTDKINQFHGNKLSPGNPAIETGWRFILAKNALRFPAQAFLGKVMSSSQPDSANLLIYSQMNPSHFGAIGNVIADMAKGVTGKQVSRAGLEGTAVGLDEGILRSFAIAEVNHLPVSARFPDTLHGRIQAGVDQTLDAINRGFFRSTGMNRWNTAAKVNAGRLVIWSMFDGAKRMAKADAFVKTGKSTDDAIRLAGFHSKLDATRSSTDRRCDSLGAPHRSALA